MKQPPQISHYSLVPVFISTLCLMLFVGLLITVGIYIALSYLFASPSAEASYIRNVHLLTGILFWVGVGALFLFITCCSTFFHFMSRITTMNKPVSKKSMCITFLHTFTQQWGLIILLLIFCWLGGKGVVTQIFAQTMPPHMQQEGGYERIDGAPSPQSIMFFSPTTEIEI